MNDWLEENKNQNELENKLFSFLINNKNNLNCMFISNLIGIESIIASIIGDKFEESKIYIEANSLKKCLNNLKPQQDKITSEKIIKLINNYQLNDEQLNNKIKKIWLNYKIISEFFKAIPLVGTITTIVDYTIRKFQENKITNAFDEIEKIKN